MGRGKGNREGGGGIEGLWNREKGNEEQRGRQEEWGRGGV